MTIRRTGYFEGYLDDQIAEIINNAATNSDLESLKASITSSEPLGVVKEYYGTTLPEHYLWADGGTIGDAISGATSLASADASDLFIVLWDAANNEGQIKLYDSAGATASKGDNAAADFAEHKRLSLPDKRGRVAIGKDNMGGTSANIVTNSSADVLTGAGGQENVTLTLAQIPSHNHLISSIWMDQTSSYGTTAAKYDSANLYTRKSIYTGNSGSGTAHNNMQPWVACNYIMRY